MPKDINTGTLFSLYKMGDLKLANRLALAPLTRCKAGPERMANALIAEYYAQRAGAGLIISEATSVSAQGNGYLNTPGIYTDEQGAAWQQVTDTVHARGIHRLSTLSSHLMNVVCSSQKPVA